MDYTNNIENTIDITIDKRYFDLIVITEKQKCEKISIRVME